MGYLLAWRHAHCDDVWISYQLHRRFSFFLFLEVLLEQIFPPNLKDLQHFLGTRSSHDDGPFKWFPPKVIPPLSKGPRFRIVTSFQHM